MLVVISPHLILKTPSHDLLLLYRDTTILVYYLVKEVQRGKLCPGLMVRVHTQTACYF